MTGDVALAVAVAAAPLSLLALVDRAVATLANARTAAEVLEARDLAQVAYDIAKRAGRLAKAKQAHDDLISAAYRAQADALEIEAQAKRRLADEYDAAQERGEVATVGGERSGRERSPAAPGAADLGLSRKEIHEARLVRDAEAAEPGIIRRTLDQVIAAGDEPTKAKVRRAVLDVVKPSTPSPAPAPAPRPTRGKEAICAKVTEALATLGGLPPAAEVVGYFRGKDSAIIVGAQLREAAAWLNAFQEAWGSTDA